MSETSKIEGFWSYLLRVVLKPWLGFWIAGTLHELAKSGKLKTTHESVAIPLKVFAQDSMMIDYLYTADLIFLLEIDDWMIGPTTRQRTPRPST